MPFYEALKFILKTSSGKVKRKNWEDCYIQRDYVNSENRIILCNKYGKYSYTPNNADMVATDWELVSE